ncbi:T9SS type A sorting domain-containing protein [Crocinitomicaceae bacterium]|nr:T9SS type A sorting domain-containing protein [Crocinitomicaceae bacterium]MDC1186423.1 T9SS type A sorting domain-containing protein [Crocinitomicaceae bacterium]
MKKLLLSITMVFAVGFINAQIYSASDSVEFSAWTLYDNDGDGVNWNNVDWTGTANPAIDALGEGMTSNSWDGSPLTPDNLMVSPSIDCSTNPTVYLNWAAFAIDPAYPLEKYAVYVVTQAEIATILASGVYPTPVFETTIPVGDTVYNESADVSALAGSQNDVHIIFRHYDVTDQFRMSVDNISFTASMPVGLEEITSEAKVYPNPANSVLNIETTASANSVSIITMDGKVVSTTTMSGLTGSVDVSNLTEGVYFYEVAVDNGDVIRNTFVKK